MEFARGEDVLEVPCGDGSGSVVLASVARSVVGIDSSESLLQEAVAQNVAANLTFLKGSASAIPVGDASIGLVVCFETSAHLSEHRAMLAEFRRVLRPSGLLLISSPNYALENGHRVFEEFREVASAFFPFVHIVTQPIATGMPVDAIDGAVPNPEYFFAICALRKDRLPEHVSSFYGEARNGLHASVRATPRADVHPSHLEMVAAERLSERVAELEAQRLQTVAELAAAQEREVAQRDEAAARLAIVEHERDDLRERLASMQELQVTERHEAVARLAMIERERDDLQGRLHAAHEREATLQREREHVEQTAALDLARAHAAAEDVERTLADERAAASRELESLTKRLAGSESARAGLKDELASALAQIATLENVRIRLHEGTARVIAERNDAREAAEAAKRGLDEARAQIGILDRACAKLRASVIEGRTAAADAERSALETAGHLALAQTELDRMLLENRQLHTELANQNSDAEKNRALLCALIDAQSRAADLMAEYERAAVRADSDRAWMEAALMLSDERLSFCRTLALREDRIAALETALRQIATDILRATASERDRYDAARRELLSNRLVRGAAAVKAILRRVAAARRAIAIPSSGSLAASTRRKAIKKTDKAKRHLRSA
jgi:SAM-dependent methyltransferase